MTKQWRVKIFGDGADVQSIVKLSQNPLISGFTTNPTLMRKAGVADYKKFAGEVLNVVREKPVSFEVLSDDFDEMEAQALEISSWGKNVFVKIPITNTKQQSSFALIERLSDAGVNLNVTAIMTLRQVETVLPALRNARTAYVSIFAGRIADAGVDPEPVMIEALKMLSPFRNLELLWASPREVFNVVQADRIGCHVITCTDDVLKKMELIGKDLDEFSLETVKMFYNDAIAARYTLPTEQRAMFAPPATPVSIV